MGRFIGRLGIVPMPAIERGLGLAERVVRRHVAKLAGVGWCQRMAAIRGDGSFVWLTVAGLRGVGLGGLPALRAPAPFATMTQHSIRVAWAAVDLERAGHEWHAGRELALEAHRWSAEMANERGGSSRRLPDLVFWPSLDETMPVAVVIGRGLVNPRRERAALHGWQAAIAAGRYAQVRYLAGPTAAGQLRRLATDIGLTAQQLIVGERVIADELPVVPTVIENVDEEVAVEAAVATSGFQRPSAAYIAAPRATFDEPAEPPKHAAQRQKLINELLGHEEPARRRPWRRRST